MNIVFYSVTRDFAGRLEQRADIDVETNISECGRDDLRTTVMTVLPHLCDENPRTAAFVLCKPCHHSLCFRELLSAAAFRGVNTGDGPRGRLVAAPDLLQSHGNLTQGSAS